MVAPAHRPISWPVREAIDSAIQYYQNKISDETFRSARHHLLVSPPGIPSFVIEVAVSSSGYVTLLTDLDMLPNECYSGVLPRTHVYNTIDNVRLIQDERHGTDKPQSLPGFMLLFQHYLNKAEVAWITDNDPLGEVTKLAALCVACLEKYGTTGSPITTDDTPRV